MKTPKLYLLPLIFLCTALQSFAQERAAVPPEGKVLVYVYSLAASTTLGRIKPSVFVDDKEVAQIRPNRFFVLYLEPGTHEIHFKKTKKRGGIEMEFKAGQRYYLRVNWKAEGTVRAEGFDILQLESARYDLKQVKPVDEENIIDKARVSAVLGELK
jgi:hypothetical protein